VKTKIKIIIVTVLLSLMLSTFINGQEINKITLAVMDFKNNSSTMRYDRLKRAIPEMLKTELSRYPEITVVERKKIESILAEHALAQAGFIEGEQAQEVARLAGAEYLITGEINTPSRHLRLDAHLIKVTSGQILGEKVSGRNEKQIEKMINLLANNLIFDLTGNGKRKEFEKITKYQSNWTLITTGTLTAATTAFHLLYSSNYKKYHQTEQLGKYNTYYNRANRYHKTRNVLMVITSASALTTFILWQSDRSEGNKIYASREKSIFETSGNQLALGILPQRDGWIVSLGMQF
jgi:TolB-like protein